MLEENRKKEKMAKEVGNGKKKKSDEEGKKESE